MNNSANFSNSELNQRKMGCDLLENSVLEKIGKLLLLCTVLLASLIGNTLLVIVMYMHKELRKTTNFFIVNMAISDFVYPLSIIPVNLVHMFLQTASGHRFCTKSLLDRFLAVVFPMKLHLLTFRSRGGGGYSPI